MIPGLKPEALQLSEIKNPSMYLGRVFYCFTPKSAYAKNNQRIQNEFGATKTAKDRAFGRCFFVSFVHINPGQRMLPAASG